MLAAGGMAQIYLAKSFGAEGFVKPLVIKRLDPRLAKTPYFTRLFVSEAKLLVTLSHGNIVPVFDFGRVGEDLYMAMEYVRGASLSQVLQAARQAGQHLDVPLAAYIAAEICKGLDYAHRKADDAGRPAGIVHRDIKPRNVLVSYEGEVKIVDFGVAKLASRMEGGGYLAGTLAYMSPEQAERQVVDPRTDIFSAGLVLYELITNDRAYAGQTPVEILAAARRAAVPAIPDDVPQQIREIIRRATERDVTSRYASAHEMEQELGEYLLVARATHGIEDTEVISPASRLSQIMAALPLPDEGAEALRVGSDAEEDPGPQGPEEMSGSVEFADPPDMAMIQNAAETFHSEFLTRVLQAELTATVQRPTRLYAAAAVLGFLSLVAIIVLVLWPAGTHQRQPVRKTAAVPPPHSVPAGDSRPRPAITARQVPDARPAKAQVEPPRVSPIAPRKPPGEGPARPVFGYLYLNSVPWSDVTIDGQPVERPTPLLRHKLAPGRHTVVLVNREHNLRKTLTVRIRRGATTWKVVNLP
jgi:serine/threonine-protein kinase